MARYGVDYYGGTTTYGEPAYIEFDATPVTAFSHSYGQAVIRWFNPEGDWSEIRLVRSRWGYPLSIYDGTTVYTGTRANAAELVVDRELNPGRFYYYEVFVYDSVNLQWRRAGGAQVLALKDFRYHETMTRNLPDFYIEESKGVSADAQGVSDFEKFLEIFSRGLAHQRGEYESLTWIRDIDAMSGSLVPYLAHDLGIQFEPEIGIRQMRIWLRNAVYLYKVKGTLLGIEGLATAVTGWGARIPADGDDITIELQANRVNLLHNPSFEVDITRWTATNATASKLEGVFESPEGYDGLSALLLSATAAGSIELSSDNTPAVIQPLQDYSAGVHVLDRTGGATARVGIRWIDDADAVLSTTLSDPMELEDGVYTRLDFRAAAPAEAASARLVLMVDDVTAGHEVEVDAAILEKGPPGRAYFDGSYGGGDYLWEGMAHASPTHFYENRIVKIARLDEILVDWVPLGVTWTLSFPTY